MNRPAPRLNPQLAALNAYIEGCIEARLAREPEPQPPVWLTGAAFQQARVTIALISGLQSQEQASAHLQPVRDATQAMIDAHELEPEDRTR